MVHLNFPPPTDTRSITSMSWEMGYLPEKVSTCWFGPNCRKNRLHSGFDFRLMITPFAQKVTLNFKDVLRVFRLHLISGARGQGPGCPQTSAGAGAGVASSREALRQRGGPQHANPDPWPPAPG